MIFIEVAGEPTPWKAPHVNRKNNHVFSPHYQKKEQIRWQIKAQWNQKAPIAVSVWCEITFHMPIPKNTSKIRRMQMLNGIIFPSTRPDRTNLAKLYEDCLIGIVLEDDSQIVDGPVRKIYSEKPKACFRIVPMTEYTMVSFNRIAT